MRNNASYETGQVEEKTKGEAGTKKAVDTTDLVKDDNRIFEIDAHHLPHSRVNLLQGARNAHGGGKRQAGGCMSRRNPTGSHLVLCRSRAS